MARAIKTIPVLRGKAAVTFNRKAKNAIAKKATTDFSKEVAITQKILAKAKL